MAVITLRDWRTRENNLTNFLAEIQRPLSPPRSKEEILFQKIQDWKTSTTYKPQSYRFNDSFQLKQSVKQKADWINTAIKVSLVLSTVCFFSLSIYAAVGAAAADSAIVMSLKPLIGLAAGSCLFLCIEGVLRVIANYSGIERQNRLMNDTEFKRFTENFLVKDGRLPDREALLDRDIHDFYCEYTTLRKENQLQRPQN